jgi:hypothetical protein
VRRAEQIPVMIGAKLVNVRATRPERAALVAFAAAANLGLGPLIRELAAPRGLAQAEADAAASGKPLSEWCRDVSLSAIGVGVLGLRCQEAAEVANTIGSGVLGKRSGP